MLIKNSKDESITITMLACTEEPFNVPLEHGPRRMDARPENMTHEQSHDSNSSSQQQSETFNKKAPKVPIHQMATDFDVYNLSKWIHRWSCFAHKSGHLSRPELSLAYDLGCRLKEYYGAIHMLKRDSLSARNKSEKKHIDDFADRGRVSMNKLRDLIRNVENLPIMENNDRERLAGENISIRKKSFVKKETHEEDEEDEEDKEHEEVGVVQNLLRYKGLQGVINEIQEWIHQYDE